MNIAELFVRVRADVSDVDRRMKGVETSLGGVERASRGAHLQTGRLGNQFANLAGQIAHVHPIVGNLAGVLSTFAVGALQSAGILAGIAAIAVLYDTITASARKARKETDDFVKSLVNEARATREATVAGAEFNQLRAEIELQDAKRASGIGIRSVLGTLLTGRATLDPADAEAASKRIADAQTAVEQSQVRVNKAYQNAHPVIKATSGAVKELTFGYNQLRDAAERVFTENAKDVKDFWRSYIEQTKEALTLTEQMVNAQNALRPSLLEAFTSIATTPIPDVNLPSVGLDDGLTKEQIKSREALIGNADENTNKLHDAIWGSAAQAANAIVGALNIGGGGKGSGLGGALGGTAGFAAGFAIGGPIGGAIGATIGNVAGSLFGGLFDHKKAVNANTQALNMNTAVMSQILNSPQGFKINLARFNATDVRELGEAARRMAARGGPNPLMAGG